MQGLVRKLSIGLDWDIDNQGLVKADRKTDGLVRSADRAEDEMGQLGRTGNRAGNKIGRAFGAATTKIKAGLGVLSQYRYQLGAAAAAGAFGIYKLTSMAGDATETVNKFRVVFGDFAGETRQWAKKYSDQIGRSEYATLDWLNSFQGVLVPMGLARDEAASLSKEMVTLAADLGSFNNVATSEAASLMQSAMIGNHRAVRSLEIQLSEATLDVAAMNAGYEKNFAELDNLTKMQLRFQEMIRQSGDAVNDATRTSDEYNNQILALKGNMRDLGIAIGNSYIPNMTDGLNVTNDFLSSLTDSEWVKPIARFGGLFTGLSGIGAVLGTLAKFGLLATIGKWGLIIGVVALALEDLWTGFQGGESVIFDFVQSFKPLGDEIIGVDKDILDSFTGLGKMMSGGFWNKDLFNEGKEQFLEGYNGLGESFKSWWESLKTWSSNNLNMQSILTDDFGDITEDAPFQWLFDEEEYNKRMESINQSFRDFWAETVNWWDNLTTFEVDYNPPKFKETMQEQWNTITNWWDNLEILNIDFKTLDIKGLIKQKYNEFTSWWNNLEILDIDFNIPDIKGLIQQKWTELNEWWEGLELGFNFDSPDIKSVIEDSWNDMLDWWDELDLGFDFDIDILGAINKQLQKLPDPVKKWIGINNEVIEKESEEIQNNNSTKINKTEVNENIEINIDGSKSPEEIAKIIERKLKTRERILAGEVGV